MNKKFTCLCLSAVMVLSSVSLLTACDGADKNDKIINLTTPAPTCFIGAEYTDASITSDTFTIEYSSKYSVTATVADTSVADIAEVSSNTVDDVVTTTYKVDGKGKEGVSLIEFTSGKKVLGSTTVSVKTAYPDATPAGLSYGIGNGLAYVHDPVIMEVEEGYEIDGTTYYYFSYSTDNEGGYGVPVKGSVDMITWDRLGCAIPDFGSNASEVAKKCKEGNSPLQDAYDLISSDANFNNVWTLWAPEVVPAADGGYWMYNSWTDAFGSRRSVIFQCYSESPAGPFEFVDFIVYSPSVSNDGQQSNAIDASVYYSADGRMYMSYGSFSDFRVIELDAKTGLRRDKAKFTVEEMAASSSFYADYYKDFECDYDEYYDELKTTDKYFGEMILKNTSIEGSVINYYKDVAVYTGDIRTEAYDESKIRYESNYYLMGSERSLSKDYNMRVFKSSTAVGTYKANATRGSKISGNFTWAEEGIDYGGALALNHFVPGHNDLITTSRGENFITYHNKVSGSKGNLYAQFLYSSLLAFNSNGDMVMSPNNYNGESLRKVTADEIVKYSNGNYLGVDMHSNDIAGIYYAEKYQLNANGTISGANDGTWKLYGDNYIYISMNGYDYYGVVMPSYCYQYDASSKRKVSGKGGLVISAIAEGDTLRTLFLQMTF